MALSDDEKLVRRKVLGKATRLLRDHLGLAQPKFAALLGADTDSMSVSRWERAVATPHPSKRERLAEIARKNGRLDLEAAFLDPVKNWKATLPGNPAYVSNLITLLEICAINQSVAGLDNDEDDFWYQALDQMAGLVKDRLVKQVKEGGTVLLLNDAQRNYWFSMLEELGISGSKRRHGEKCKKNKKTR